MVSDIEKNNILSKLLVMMEDISLTDVEFLTDERFQFNFATIKNELQHVVSFAIEAKKNLSKHIHNLDHFEKNQNLLESSQEILNNLKYLSKFVDSNKFSSYDNTPESIMEEISDEKNRLIETFRKRSSNFRLFLSSLFIEKNEELFQKNDRLEKEKVNLTINLEEDIQTVYSNLFSLRASKHKDNSRWWLGGIASLSVMSIGYALCLIHRFNTHASLFGTSDYLNFFDHVALRVILFSLIGYALHFMSRAYSFDKMQQIKNEDKDAALQCFPQFMRTSIKDDPELHRAVMVKITEAIFDTRDIDDGNEVKGDKLAPSSNITLSLAKNG